MLLKRIAYLNLLNETGPEKNLATINLSSEGGCALCETHGSYFEIVRWSLKYLGLVERQ